MQQDNQYLIDIFNAAQRITEYTASVSLHSFYEDVQLQDKVVRRLLTIGKTAQRISAATRQDVNGIAWSAIAKMKERLLQDDPVIDADQVWSIAHTEIPQLIEAIRQNVIKDSSGSLIYA
ncbi:MAG: HepT-like ribonuclease domain-containing protein [Cyanobacteria bacterium P01_F01_bin.3]